MGSWAVCISGRDEAAARLAQWPNTGDFAGHSNDLGKQLDSRYARLMAMLIACTSILVTALGAAIAVLK